MRAQGDFFVAEEVFPNLSLPVLSEIFIVPVDTAPRLIKFYDSDRVICARLLTVVASHHVTVESFGAKYNQDVNLTRETVSELVQRWLEMMYLRTRRQYAV